MLCVQPSPKVVKVFKRFRARGVASGGSEWHSAAHQQSNSPPSRGPASLLGRFGSRRDALMKRRSFLQAAAFGSSGVHVATTEAAYLADSYFRSKANSASYIIPPALRQTAVLIGSGASTYGPFSFKIFDVEDVEVWARPSLAEGFSKVSAIVKKVNGETLDLFTISVPGGHRAGHGIRGEGSPGGRALTWGPTQEHARRERIGGRVLESCYDASRASPRYRSGSNDRLRWRTADA